MSLISNLQRPAPRWLTLLFVWWGCAPSPVAPPRPPDAGTDGAAGDVTGDLGAPDAVGTPCGDGGVCASGRRCDLAQMRCVDCLVTDHCGGATPVCASGRCVAATPCTSSRMCPGQVCDLTAMRCVDCVADLDCAQGLRCVANVCTAAVSCRSSRDCSAAGLVCDAAQMRCVECVEDRDCPMGMRCNASRACVAPSGCTPGVATCASPLRVRECNAMGVAAERDCAVGEICMAGTCRMLLCSPGAVSCESTSARRTCTADGMAYTVTACAAGESCVGGECRAPGCVPGAASCASATERRVCNADGRTFTAMTCPAGQSCSGGVCAASTDCPTGQTRCGAACVDLQRDATNCGRCANACPAGVACDAGMCAVPTAPMLFAHANHALVVLPDGSVLAIGGYSYARMELIRDVERYDPVTNRWEARASLPVATGPGLAALLADGRVVVGGAASTLQVYTPSTNSWAQLTPTSIMAHHVVFAEREGRIYSFHYQGIVTYDLATLRWNPGARLEPIALLPIGAVDPMGRLYAFYLSDATRRAVYTPSSNTWMVLPGYGYGRLGETIAFASDGTAYGFGGSLVESGPLIDRVRRIDLTANTATPLAPMREARSTPTVALLPGGRFLVTGGLRRLSTPGQSESVNTAAIYTIATNTWR